MDRRKPDKQAGSVYWWFSTLAHPFCLVHSFAHLFFKFCTFELLHAHTHTVLMRWTATLGSVLAIDIFDMQMGEAN